MDPVKFRDCGCPGTPHAEGDTVTFRPRLSFDASLEALRLIFLDTPEGRPAGAWQLYLLEGPESWNLVDAEGEPLPLDRTALLDLPFEDQYEIADKADDIYRSQVLSPLVRRSNLLSSNGRTSATSRPRSTRSSKRQ